VTLAVLVLALSGCGLLRGCTSSRPPIHINPSMDQQPKVLPQSESAFFYDGSGMRAPVEGTVARGELNEDDAFYRGVGPDGKPVATIPVAVDEALLTRGRARYAIYCQPCHDARGDGKGILFVKGNVPTASFHTEKVRAYPDGQLFDIVTNGSGLMPSYRWPIPPADRWAIIAHVRELTRERAEAVARRAAP
jgi:mono/diheme cytochrome c family protein